jgi:hypothetical protein
MSGCNKSCCSLKKWIGRKVLSTEPFVAEDGEFFPSCTVFVVEKCCRGKWSGCLSLQEVGGKKRWVARASHMHFRLQGESVGPEEGVDDMTHRDVGWAIRKLKERNKVTRTGWSDKNVWLILVEGHEWFTCMGDNLGIERTHRLPFIAVKITDDGFMPWVPSQADMLSEDWEIVE